jgi:hypothetical protein
MTRTKILTAALAVSVAATCIAAPAFARGRTTLSFDANLEAIGPELAARAAQRMAAFEANLEAIGPELAARAAQRTAAIRACSSAAAPLGEPAGRGKQSDRERYRACMAGHGQMP